MYLVYLHPHMFLYHKLYITHHLKLQDVRPQVRVPLAAPEDGCVKLKGRLHDGSSWLWSLLALASHWEQEQQPHLIA